MARKYRILKPLGRGGEGSVWLAVHLQTEQLWAVKEIRRRGDGQEFHELDMMKKLRHPSLPRIIDVLEDKTVIYLIMEYVRGHNLEILLREKGRLSAEQVLEVGCQVSRALSYLHTRSVPVLHLDIKPANIILEKGGRLVLVDFGAADRYVQGEQEKARRGTEGFAAPEQYDRNQPLDIRTDVFGLGATLYYLISGVHYSAALEKSRVPGCPEQLGAVIRESVRKDPEKRYSSCKKLEQELRRLKKKRNAKLQRIKLWGALWLATAATGVAFREIPREFQCQAQEAWNYEKLLEEALCTDWETGGAYYQKAVFLKPDRKEAYLQLLAEADADACFSREEEARIRNLLHGIPVGQDQTYEELLEQEAEEYGQVALRLGMLYWYGYEEEGGKRIGTGWFRKAAAAAKAYEDRESPKAEKLPDWTVKAEIFAQMGSYYESLGKRTEEEEDHTLDYWRDLGRLLEQDVMGSEKKAVELRFYGEAVNQVLFLADELRRAGISKKELTDKLDLMEERTRDKENGDTQEELMQEVLSGIQTARKILSHQEQAESKENIVASGAGGRQG